jgi:hypothetical protein
MPVQETLRNTDSYAILTAYGIGERVLFFMVFWKATPTHVLACKVQHAQQDSSGYFCKTKTTGKGEGSQA